VDVDVTAAVLAVNRGWAFYSGDPRRLPEDRRVDHGDHLGDAAVEGFDDQAFGRVAGAEGALDLGGVVGAGVDFEPEAEGVLRVDDRVGVELRRGAAGELGEEIEIFSDQAKSMAIGR